MAQILDLGKLRFNWAGTYSPSTEYTYNDLVKYGNTTYAYISTTAGTGFTPNTNPSKWQVVAEGVDWRGTYTSTVKYYVNDIVTDGTSTYIVVAEHTAVSGVLVGNANVELLALGQSGIPNQSGNANKVLKTDGSITSWTGSVSLNKSYFGNSQGAGASGFETSGALTNVTSAFSGSVNDFAQLVMYNAANGANASTDFIAYTQSGNNNDGFIDMGITSNNFSAANYGITGPVDGYIFMSAPRGAVFNVVTTQTVGTNATLTTEFPHGFVNGNVIHVEDTPGYNGEHTISNVTSTTFSFTTNHAPQSATNISPFGKTYKPVGNGNLVFATDNTGLQNNIVFAAGGYESGTTQMEIYPDEKVFIDINTDSTNATTGALVVAGGAGFTGSVSINGLLRVAGLTYIGSGAEAFNTSAALTNAKTVMVVNGGPYAQFAITNPTANASADVIVYANNGNDTAGWIDMGITNSGFNQPTFGLTGPNDGYIFFEAPATTTGKGNLVIATGANGSENKIIFAAGGFGTGNDQMSITPNVNVHIEIPTPSTSPTTGALTVVGGVGITGDVNIAGNITFGGSGTQVGTANLAVSDPMIFVGDGSITNTDDLAFVGEYKVPIADGTTKTITNKSLTANVATLTTSAAHNYQVGTSVVVAGVDATFNGTYTITAVTTNTFSYAKTAGNVSTTSASGTAVAAFISTSRWTSLFKDNPTASWYLVSNITSKPSTTINLNQAGLVFDALKVGGLINTGAGSIAGNFDVNTNRFTVNATTGDTLVAGALTVNGSGIVTSAGGSFGIANQSNQVNIGTGGSVSLGASTGITQIGTGTVNMITAPTIAATALNVGSNNVSRFSVSMNTGNVSTIGNIQGLGTLSSGGNFDVNTNSFTVNATTGNTAILGDLAVNTSKFNVTALTGNTSIAGTLGVNGTVTVPSVTINNTPVANTDAATVGYVKGYVGGQWVVRNTNYNLVAGDAIWADSSAGTFILTLPASPVVNFDRIRIADLASSWANTPVTLARNGNLIMGLAEDMSLNVKNASLELIYSGSTYGWRFV